jgi:hypothetical protein
MADKSRGRRTGALKLYRSYVFRNKDPAIDELRTVIQDHYGKCTHKEWVVIEADGGPTVSTMTNWFKGDTRKPQNASLEAAGRSFGYKRVWIKDDKK